MTQEQRSPRRQSSSPTINAIALASPPKPQAVVPIADRDPHYDVGYFGSRLGSHHGNDFIHSFTFELNPDLTASNQPPEEIGLLSLDPELKPFDTHTGGAGPPASDSSSDQETQVAPDYEYDMLGGLPLSPKSQVHGQPCQDARVAADHRYTNSTRRTGSQAAAAAATTPLHVCARMGNLKILEILLQSGADVNAVDGEGRTALHYGVQNGREEIVRALLGHSADASILDNHGMSVMHVAVVNSQEIIVILLLEAGVDPNI